MEKVTLYEWNGEDEENIFKKFDRTKATIDEDVKIIQKWMQMQPHLPEVADENSIKMCLILSKCSVELAKKKIDSHYTVKARYPELYTGFNPRLPHMKRVFDGIYYLPLPKLTEQLTRVYVYKIRDRRMQKEMKYEYVTAHSLQLIELHLKESLELGLSLIFDLTDFTAENVKQFDPVTEYKSTLIFTEIYKFPIKDIYVVNPPKIVNAIKTFVESLLKPKIVQRVSYSDIKDNFYGLSMRICKKNELLNYFPKEILPKDYGGEEKSLEELNELMKLKFCEYQNRFDEIENFKIDSSLKPKMLKNDDILGVYGNFRKLNID